MLTLIETKELILSIMKSKDIMQIPILDNNGKIIGLETIKYILDRKKIDILQRVDNHFITYLKEKNIYKKIWQAFAILLPVKSVGVMGDERTYSYSIAIRAVTSVDGMTADFYMFSKEDLTEISKSIISNVKEVNRVLYDFTSKPPGTIEWE